MSKKHTHQQFSNPAEIARETFRRLAIDRVPPTPDAYRKLYLEISGAPAEDSTPAPVAALPVQVSAAENLLKDFAESLRSAGGEMAGFGHRFQRAMQAENWLDYSKGLEQLAQRMLSPAPEKPSGPAESAPTRASFALVDTVAAPDQRAAILKELLFRTLTLALASLLKHNPPLATESESLGLAVKEAENEAALNQVSTRLKQLCFKVELQAGDSAEQQELLLRLFDLLLTNIHDLLDNDNWLRGQIEVIQNLISGPIDHRALQDATRSLKDVIYKQGALKNSLAESRTSVQNMMAAFVDRLDAMAASTGNYQERMDGYSQKLSGATELAEVSYLIGDILTDTRAVHSETLRSRDMIVAAQKEVAEAEARIKELENKLAHMSELVREDQLTGSLNRRGMDDVFEREADRADRRNTPLCVALLDLDNFKKLNDTHGHAVGDEALIHLVRIVKQTLRSVDVIARYGGEEFLIIMPETELDEAALAMTRVQRELTKHFFTADDQRLFITFSAGVALRGVRESQDALIKRADKAMYEAKQSGKNRVVKAV